MAGMRFYRISSVAMLLAAVAVVASCSEVQEVLTRLPESGVSSDGGSDAESPTDAAASDGAIPDAASGSVVLDAGSVHACAIIDGALYCWGQNQRGRLGVGDALDRDAPARAGSAADWTTVTASEDHSCAVRAGGELFCFGANDFGQLGVADVTEALAPLAVSLPGPVRSASAEANFSCAVLESGELYCWGDNFEGQLGQNDTFPGTNEPEPLRVEAWTDVLAVDAGQGHTCALRAPGTLWCWGRNTASELGMGDGAAGQIRTPTRTGSGEDWIDVAAGQNHSCGLRADGTLSSWGNNQFGNLGTGDFDHRSAPAPIASARSFVQVSTDTFHSCAVDGDGELWCWGRNVEGQLGLGDNVDRPSPERVPGGGFAFVAVGRFFTCAVRVDRSIWCAGANEGGQLGVGDRERRNAMSPIAMPVD